MGGLLKCTVEEVWLSSFSVCDRYMQVPGLNVWYGPDTYMGQNIVQLFKSLAEADDEEIQKLHPQHTQASIRCGVTECTEGLDEFSIYPYSFQKVHFHLKDHLAN